MAVSPWDLPSIRTCPTFTRDTVVTPGTLKAVATLEEPVTPQVFSVGPPPPQHRPAPNSAWRDTSEQKPSRPDVSYLQAPPPLSHSITLADLPSKLSTDVDKLKLHIEVHRALIHAAADSRGLKVTDEEFQTYLKALAEKEGLPVKFLQEFLKESPQSQLFLDSTRQQLLLVKLSGNSTEPTEEELREAFDLAQAGRVTVGRIEFASKPAAQKALVELRETPFHQVELVLKKYFVTETFNGISPFTSYPPPPSEAIAANLQDGEFSEVTHEGEHFVIYHRTGRIKPNGTFEQLKSQLRAQLIVNKTYQIGETQLEQIRRAYQLHVVPIYQPPIQVADPPSTSSTKPNANPENAEEFQKLFSQFNELMDQRRFADAELIAKQAQAMAINNHVAETMLLNARFAQEYLATPRPEFERLPNGRMRLKGATIFAEADEMTYDKSNDTFSFKSEGSRLTTLWRKASPHGAFDEASSKSMVFSPSRNILEVSGPASSVRQIGDSEFISGRTESVRAAEAKLDAKVELDATDLPLRKVINLLAASADVNILCDNAGLKEAGVSESTPVTRMLKGVKLRSALKIVLEPLKLGYVFDRDVLKITSRERADGQPIVAAYPVSDLLGTEDAYDELGNLRNLIMVSVVGEKAWIDSAENVPKIHFNPVTKTLVVRHTRAMHGELTAFLDLLRKTKPVDATKPGTMPYLSDEERRITDALQKPISVQFEQAPLKQVLEHIAKDRGLNIVLSEAGLQEVSATPTLPMSISLADVRLSSTLDLLLEPLQLGYVIKNEVLQITSRQRAEGEEIVVAYPVPDMIWRENDPSGDLSSLCDMLMSMVDPNSWEIKGAPATVRVHSPTRSLVVRQTRANHARIRELLATVRNTKNE